MPNLKLNIVGAGRVGQTLGKLLYDNQLVDLQSLCNQTLNSAQAAAQFMGAGEAVSCLEALKPADLTLLSVPDSKIETLAQAWAQGPAAQSGSILFHASGSLSAQAMKAASQKGVLIASVHPLKSFASPTQAYQSFAGTFCAIEGDEIALEILSPLFESLGADMGRIASELKAKYHAACVMACGGLTALYATTEGLLMEAGVPEEKIARFLSPYMQMTLDNNASLGSAQALTGPIARGDQETVTRHLEALSDSPEAVQQLYQVLSALQRGLQGDTNL